MEKETIAAISTAVGSAGIGIVRISGKDAVEIAERIYRSPDPKKKLGEMPSHTIHYGHICDADDTIDEVLVMLMRGPKTYTGEDTVEINCHGGSYVTRRVLDAAIKYGARPANPGEFTKRAFLNGKMDLSQAESVIDIIESENEYALKNSLGQLRGSMQRAIREMRKEILYHTAFIETALDDPEHISVDGYGDNLVHIVDNLLKKINQMLITCENGRILKEGIRTVIVGKPNVGKSSLLNVLAGQERAIVTEIAGTTRDALEEQIRLSGIPLNVVDTAGIRDTVDIVEKIGVDKAENYAANADLIVYVVDASVPLDENDRRIMQMIGEKKAIVLLNKSDLSTCVDKKELEEAMKRPTFDISAKEERGLEAVAACIKDMFFHGELSFDDQTYITNARHKAALTDARTSLENVKTSIETGLPEDFYSIDLMDAYASLGKIIGESVGEDLINEIFSKFCMGK